MIKKKTDRKTEDTKTSNPIQTRSGKVVTPVSPSSAKFHNFPCDQLDLPPTRAAHADTGDVGVMPWSVGYPALRTVRTGLNFGLPKRLLLEGSPARTYKADG